MSGKGKPKTLECTSVTKRVYQKRTIHNTILSWRVRDYEELKCGVVYFQVYEKLHLKCCFRILKTENGNLSLTVTSPCISPNTTAEFLILDELRRTSINREAKKLQDGVYTAMFHASEFMNSVNEGSKGAEDVGNLNPTEQDHASEKFLIKSGYLCNGVLTVSFKYASDAYARHQEQDILTDPDILTDLDELCSDLKRMYLEAIYPDFEVHVGEYVFSTHKFILSARSEYFKDMLAEGSSLTGHRLVGDQFHPGVVHEVFLYMYSGELKELSIDCMLRVYWTAVYLKVGPLCTRCLQYFGMYISVENYEGIIKYALMHDLTNLKNEIIHAQKNLPGINICSVIMKLRRDLSNAEENRSQDSRGSPNEQHETTV